MNQYDKQAKELVAKMTLEEKASLCSGYDFWYTKSVERLGFPRIMVSDGPHGLRKQDGTTDHLGVNDSVPSTCFPAAATTACSFDTNLMEEMGKALGKECLQEGVAVLLGPGVNIKRSPLCGRNFEYFSEDPLLAGEMAAGMIKGIQSKGIGTSLKHYAANNQETRRMSIDEAIDERALREIYLTNFEIAVKKARPWTVMCCYNQVNGEYGSQNNYLLNKILRDEWGFDGLVVTDWGAIVDRVKGLQAGLDLEMPYVNSDNDKTIVKAVKEGNLNESVLDTIVLRIIKLVLTALDSKQTGYRYDAEAHHKLASRIASESSVLLKNEGNLLPLSKSGKYALIGTFAEQPRYQGAGSSRINPFQLEKLINVFSERNITFDYAPGYSLDHDDIDEQLIVDAVNAAIGKDAVIICIGLPDAYESEGFDRKHLRLPLSHIVLLERVAAANPDTVVLLSCGGAVEMPWLVNAKALLMLYLGGQAGASASADLIFGDVVPSGKLAETFPIELEDNPSYNYFPGGTNSVHYRESIYVGYRYYDKADIEVLFPFGHGLSYTSFAYSDLKLDKLADGVQACVTVKNTGSRAGAEVVQFYISQKTPSVFKPVRELGSFAKVLLQSGESKQVSVNLPMRAFSFYDTDIASFSVEEGEYTVFAAASSRSIRCEANVMLTGSAPKTITQSQAYVSLSKGTLDISEKDFAALYGKSLPSLEIKPDELITKNSNLGDVSYTTVGAGILGKMQKIMRKYPQLNGMDLLEFPLRALAIFGGPSGKELTDMIEMMNLEIRKSEKTV